MSQPRLFDHYIAILREELIPALGCTEPIAIAYAAATARAALGSFPRRLEAACSGNIIKNAQSVTVPHSGNLRGIRAAAILGALAGDPSLQLEVLSTVTEADAAEAKALLVQGFGEEKLLDTEEPLHIVVTAEKGDDTVVVELKYRHNNIIAVSKNGTPLAAGEAGAGLAEQGRADRSLLSLDNILDFCDQVELDLVQDLLDRQITFNLAIAEEGLSGKYGANVGATLLHTYGRENLDNVAKAYAAAGSDARMSGCVLPVIINSGSGNQGMAVSLPVIIYARASGSGEEKLYRSLLLSNLISIYQKIMIGHLSAFCGAVSAACGAGAGITYLQGGSLQQIQGTITNILANVSGIVCDGAKPSCAAKIASSLDAALMAHHLAMSDQVFQGGEGLVKAEPEETMQAIGRLASKGMCETDQEILRIMLDEH